MSKKFKHKKGRGSLFFVAKKDRKSDDSPCLNGQFRTPKDIKPNTIYWISAWKNDSKNEKEKLLLTHW